MPLQVTQRLRNKSRWTVVRLLALPPTCHLSALPRPLRPDHLLRGWRQRLTMVTAAISGPGPGASDLVLMRTHSHLPSTRTLGLYTFLNQ